MGTARELRGHARELRGNCAGTAHYRATSLLWLLCKFAGAHNCGGNLATSISCQLSAFGIQQPIFDGIAFLFVAFAIVMAQLHLSTPVVYFRVARSVWLLCIISIVMAILATKIFAFS